MPLINGGKHRVTEEQIERYFASVGRTEQALTAVYLLNRDESLLEELRNFPDSVAALEMLAIFGSDEAQAEADARRMVELDPRNPAGHYLIAMWEARNGNIDQAMETLKQSAEMEGAISIDTPQLHGRMVDALLLMGYDMVEANVYLLRHPVKSMTGYTDFSRVVSAVLRDGDLSEGDRARYASELLVASQRISSPTPMVDMARWSDIKNEIDLLGYLPPNYEYGDNNTVGARKEELREMLRQESEAVAQGFQVLKELEPASVNAYFDLLGREGAIAARDWLLSRDGDTSSTGGR